MHTYIHLSASNAVYAAIIIPTLEAHISVSASNCQIICKELSSKGIHQWRSGCESPYGGDDLQACDNEANL